MTNKNYFLHTVCVHVHIYKYIYTLFSAFFHIAFMSSIHFHASFTSFRRNISENLVEASLGVRFSVCISMLVASLFWNQISFPVIFNVPGFTHQFLTSLRFTHLFLNFMGKKSVEFLKIHKAKHFSYCFWIIVVKILC